MSDVKDKDCPFHQKNMYTPKNMIMAMSDQLHTNTKQLYQASLLSEGKDRDSMTKNIIKQMRMFLNSLEITMNGHEVEGWKPNLKEQSHE